MEHSHLSEPEITQTLAAIKSGDEKTIDQIYQSYKPQFINWASSKFSLSEADIIDCWQDSVIAFYEQVVSGRLETLDVGLKTYLFAIGRNKLLYKLRSKKSNIQKEQVFAENYFLENEASGGYADLDDIQGEEEKRLQKAMQSLSEKNRAILISRYYDGLSLEQIQKKGNYSSINAVSASISRAISILKKVVNNEKNLLFLLSF